MAEPKTATLMLRIQPSLKQELRELAAREHRSLSNMIEVLILDYDRRREGLTPAPSAAVAQNPDPSSPSHSV